MNAKTMHNGVSSIFQGGRCQDARHKMIFRYLSLWAFEERGTDTHCKTTQDLLLTQGFWSLINFTCWNIEATWLTRLAPRLPGLVLPMLPGSIFHDVSFIRASISSSFSYLPAIQLSVNQVKCVSEYVHIHYMVYLSGIHQTTFTIIDVTLSYNRYHQLSPHEDNTETK